MDAVAEGREDDVESDYGSEDDSIIIKLLIPGPAAGSIIGKGGSTINEFQIQTGARIQLSRTNETFPGTTDRLVTLGGTREAILGAMHLHDLQARRRRQGHRRRQSAGEGGHPKRLVRMHHR